MRHLVVPAVLCLTVCLLSLCAAAQSPPQRDAQAVLVLSQSVDTLGGRNLGAIRDTYAELTVKTRDGDQFSYYSATLKTLGNKKWRIESQDPQGPSVFIVNDGRGQLAAGAETESFSGLSVAEAGNWLIPLFSILSDWRDPNLRIEYQGAEQGGSIHHIRVQRVTENKGWEEVFRPSDLYLDAQTLLPVKLTYSLHPPANLLVDIPVEVEYSQYRNISGILVPFHVTYSIRGRLMLEYNFTSFAVNQGASEADFALR